MRVSGSPAFPDRHQFVGVYVTDAAAVTATDRRVGRTSADKRGVGGLGDKNTYRRVGVSSDDKQREGAVVDYKTDRGVIRSADKDRIRVVSNTADSAAS